MDLVLDLIISIVSIAVIAQYSWSLKAHFNSPKMPTGTVVISVVVLATAAIYLTLLWVESQPLLAQFVGLVIECLALWLFWAAIKASRAARLKMAFDVQNP
ncbi:MAG: isoprenylcysteine carboxylmethyltransferase family protein, partial [Devosia sp.]|nr:isoprenylcysteine carboxylmethyltransferase family protein [Devosia sp.]